MTEQEFTTELNQIEKPDIEKPTFIYAMLKGWISKTLQAILLLCIHLNKPLKP